jgi:hypothetical protein
MRKIWILLAVAACGQPPDKLEEVDQAVCQEDQPPPCCPTCCDSPIVVDVAGDGLHLTSAVDGVSFALAPGHANQWSWTPSGSDDAFLVLDRNGDDQITDGAELFGNHTEQAPNSSPNGFLAMAWYDDPARGGNGDGVLDARDEVWPRLRLWTDRDHDGWSAPSEVTSVGSAVQSFNLRYKASTETDANGNEYKYRSTLVPAPGSSTSIVVTDAWLHTTPASTTGPQSCTTKWHCETWAYAYNLEQTEACNNSQVQGDQLVNVTWVYNGGGDHAARLVSRRYASDIEATAATLSQLAVVNALGSSCRDGVHPSPDWHATSWEQGSYGLNLRCVAVLECGGCGG